MIGRYTRAVVLIALILTGMLPSAAVSQQTTPGQPLGRIYLSASNTTYDPVIQATQFVPFKIYVMAELDYGDIGRPELNSGTGIGAWEAQMNFPAAVIITNAAFRGNGVNVGTNTDVVIGLGNAILAATTPIDLVAYDAIITTAGVSDAVVDIGPYSTSSFNPPTPGMLDSQDIGECTNLVDGSGVKCLRPFARTDPAVINPTGPFPFVTPIDSIQAYDALGSPQSPFVGLTKKVRGTVVASPSATLLGLTYLDDGTGGLQIFDTPPPSFDLDDEVEVEGTISSRNGEIVLVPSTTTLIGPGSAPVAQAVTVTQLLDADGSGTRSAADFERVGQLFEVTGDVVEPFGSYSYGIADAGDTVAVDFESSPTIYLVDFNRGDTYQVTGVLGIEAGTMVLRPRLQSDLVQLVDAGPQLAASPLTLDFGTVPVGSYTTRSFVMTNNGPTNTTAVGNVSADCSNFQVIGGGGPFALAGGDSITVHVRFIPSGAGEFSCQVDTGDTSAVVAVRGTGEIAPMCVLSRTTLDFPGLQVGLSAVDSFTIRNAGGGILSGNLFSSSSEFLLTRGAGLFALAAGESLTVEVQFTPTVAGSPSMDLGGSFFCAPVTVSGSAVEGPVFAVRGDHSIGGQTSSVTLEDYDQDGDVDLFVARRGAVAELYQNTGGAFDLVVPDAIPSAVDAWSGVFFDRENDHRLDMYVGLSSGASHYLQNAGAFGFVESSGEPIRSIANGRAGAFADVDLDGDLDLFVPTAAGSPDILLMNEQPTGFFAEQSVPALSTGSNSVSAVWGDFDRDGDPDLYVVRFGEPNLLLRNDLGAWVDVTSPALADSGQGMDAAWADYDNDGDLDLYLANLDRANRLYRNDQGVFVDATPAMLADARRSSTPSWADLDNDGDLDLCYPNGPGANGVFLNVGGEFYDGRIGALSATTNNAGMAVADVDGDGDLDAYLAEWDSTGANVLLENQSAGANHWLEFELYGVQSNAFGVGATIRVVAGGQSQWRTVGAQHGSISRGPQRVHFGLGSAAVVDTVEIRWPSGVMQTDVNIAADQVLHSTEGGSVTAVDPGDGAPRRTRVVGSRPNPFNPQTTIHFEVAVPGRVEMTVYDVSGRRVRRLLSENRNPGAYDVSWNGADDAGRRVSSGVYLVRLVAGGVESAVRVVMVK